MGTNYANQDDNISQGLIDVSVQLHYTGREGNTLIANICPVFPVALPGAKCLELPHELTTEEIYALIQKSAAAARKCRDAGVDAVEVAAHHYLIGQFLSSSINKRFL